MKTYIVILYSALIFSRGHLYAHDIFEAIEQESCEGVINALRLRPDLNIQDDTEDTPLLRAIRLNKSKAFIGYLLNNGFDINSANLFGITPLQMAVQCAHVELVEFLLSRGADVTRRDGNGDTVLSKVALGWSVAVRDRQNDYCDCYLKIIKVLLEHGAEVDDVNKQNMTALMIAREKLEQWAPHAKDADFSILEVLQAETMNQ